MDNGEIVSFNKICLLLLIKSFVSNKEKNFNDSFPEKHKSSSKMLKKHLSRNCIIVNI